MAVIRVIYQSKKGRTEKVAQAVAGVCGVEAIDITVPSTMAGTDLLFVGIPSYSGRVENAFIDYLDQLPVNSIKGAALFTVSTDGKDHSSLVINSLKHKGIEVYPETLALPCASLFHHKGRPNAEDLEEAKNWTLKVLHACRLV